MAHDQLVMIPMAHAHKHMHAFLTTREQHANSRFVLQQKSRKGATARIPLHDAPHDSVVVLFWAHDRYHESFPCKGLFSLVPRRRSCMCFVAWAASFSPLGFAKGLGPRQSLRISETHRVETVLKRATMKPLTIQRPL